MAAELKKLFEGKWTNYKDDNFDKFLDKMDVGMLKKKLASTVNPTLKVKVEGETIKVSISAGPKKTKVSFTLDTTFKLKMEMSGTGVSSIDSGVWTTQVTPKDAKKGKSMTIIREIIDGDLVQTMVIDGVTCKRYFRRT